MIQLVMLIMCSCDFSELKRNENLALILMKWCKPKDVKTQDEECYNKLDNYLYQTSVNVDHQKLISLLEGYSKIKNKLFNIANMHKCGYSLVTLSKISKLALVGYQSLAHTVRFMDFFCMRHTSMHLHFMAKLEGDTFECAGILTNQSTNPFQFCHPHLVVNGKASKQSLGGNHHA